MNTKLLLQILLALGCLALAIGVVSRIMGSPEWVGYQVTPEGWWRGAMACWMLVVAIRMVYPAKNK